MKQIAPLSESVEAEGGSRGSILCVDDDYAIRFCLSRVLRKEGYHVKVVDNGQDAWDHLEAENFNLLATDYQMPQMTGGELVTKLRRKGLTLPVIVAASELAFFTDSQNAWLNVVTLQKPFTLERLKETVSSVLQYQVA